MPAIHRDKTVKEFAGLVCDVCGTEHRDRCFDFHFTYMFGYGSPIDGDRVDVAICDLCLELLIKEHVPGAQWNVGDADMAAVEHLRNQRSEADVGAARVFDDLNEEVEKG